MSSSISPVFRHRGFLACVVLLLAFTVTFEVVTARRNVQFPKLALPLRKPLDKLDQSKLAPYKLAGPPGTLQADMLDELGTDQYIQWDLVDTGRDGAAEVRMPVHLFVTYYTGVRDQVPHVPEVCYGASGHQETDHRLIEVEIPGLGEGKTIPVQVLQFERNGLLGPSRRIVMYTFHANGQFCRGRRHVQTVVNSPLTKYAYFSKLELSFDISDPRVTREAAVEEGKRFLKVVVPVLVAEHWPDWEAANRQPEPQPAGPEGPSSAPAASAS